MKEDNRRRNASDLEKYSELIIVDFNKRCPATIDEAAERIEKLTKIKRSRVTVAL